MSLDSCAAPKCQFCDNPLQHTFVDLGMSPLCERILTQAELNSMEPFYPLHVWVCGKCFLVQVQEYVSPGEIFNDYAYFSSYSDSWLAHASNYVDMATDRFGLGSSSHVVEIASNDGYLLQYFVAKGVPVTGIEPAANVAESAVAKGINTVVRFFGVETAEALGGEGKHADLIIGNNVLAHVPNINDLVGGMKRLLKAQGVVTMEFPHLLRLMEGNQFDTIYHEHFSYLSFSVVNRIFSKHGLALFDVDELPTHGGSLRIYACHDEDLSRRGAQPAVDAMLKREQSEGFDRVERYTGFSNQVIETKRRILECLIDLKDQGKTIAGYGAPGKGNTLLNYCAIRTDMLDYTVDRNPFKHGKYCPGTHIPIHPVEHIRETKPDYLFILPWNLKKEIMDQMSYVREWGAKFIVPIPEVEICP